MLRNLRLALTPRPSAPRQAMAAARSVPAPRPGLGLAIRRQLRMLESLAFRAARRSFARAFAALVRIAIFGGIALAVGLGSAFTMIDSGSGLTVHKLGPWQTWIDAARPEADPYTRAHFARIGWLARSSVDVRYFVATHDGAGSRLHSDCEYELAGPLPVADWWSLAVYDDAGALIESENGRHAITGASAVSDGRGIVTIRLAGDARPGNWLSVASGERLTLVLREYGTRTAVDARSPPPFTIARIECR